MNTIEDEVRITTKADEAYRALSTQAGYRGWWNLKAQVATTEGGLAQLDFLKDGQPVHMESRIDEQQPKRVRWTCVKHDMPSWIGTTLDWRIESGQGDVRVSLVHAGWKGEAPDMVAQGWKHFLGSLKSYLETGTGQPW
jgi:uncharacterized protein YndB with AHSA1/START domain